MKDSAIIPDHSGENCAKPKVLAVIPAYNSSEYVKGAITSLLQQGYPDLRIVVIDDCSSDNTSKILDNYQGEIEVTKNEQNMGFAHSLNRALSMTKDEEFLFVLEDDVELVTVDYISRAIRDFENEGDNNKIALICGQAIDFSPERLSLTKRAFARYLNLDYQESGIMEVSYSLLKADLIKVAALREVEGFSSAGNPKLGTEDQILAKKLRGESFILLKDTSLKYQLDFARRETLADFLKSEVNAGKTLAVAVGQRLISTNPTQSAETRRKSNYRRTQVTIVALVCLSLLLLIYSYQLAIGVILGILALEFINYLRKSKGFKSWEKPYFATVGIINDFVFSFSFYWGAMSGLKDKIFSSF